LSQASSGCTHEHEAQAARLLKHETAMNTDKQARMRVAALIYLIVNAVVFGVGLISVLMTPALAQHAFFWIPAIIVTSFVLSAPLAWFIAPSMMMRFILARRTH
jgi:fatty acid desaturase